MAIFFFWFLLAVAVGAWAEKRGRGPVAWFFLALVLSPVLAAVFLAVMEPKTRADEKVCPACAETVKAEATVCKHCGHVFPKPLPDPRIRPVSGNL